MIPPAPAGQQSCTAELLKPGADAVERTLQLLDAAKMGVLVVGGGLLLLAMGARLERHLMKRQLEVLDGGSAGGDIDLTQERGTPKGAPSLVRSPTRTGDIVAEGGAGGGRT